MTSIKTVAQWAVQITWYLEVGMIGCHGGSKDTIPFGVLERFWDASNTSTFFYRTLNYCKCLPLSL